MLSSLPILFNPPLLCETVISMVTGPSVELGSCWFIWSEVSWGLCFQVAELLMGLSRELPYSSDVSSASWL